MDIGRTTVMTQTLWALHFEFVGEMAGASAWSIARRASSSFSGFLVHATRGVAQSRANDARAAMLL